MESSTRRIQFLLGEAPGRLVLYMAFKLCTATTIHVPAIYSQYMFNNIGGTT